MSVESLIKSKDIAIKQFILQLIPLFFPSNTVRGKHFQEYYRNNQAEKTHLPDVIFYLHERTISEIIGGEIELI